MYQRTIDKKLTSGATLMHRPNKTNRVVVEQAVLILKLSLGGKMLEFGLRMLNLPLLLGEPS